MVKEFSAFYDNLSMSSPVQIEQALEQLAAEIRNGRLDATSAVTLGTSDGFDASEDFGWTQVVRDLEDLGISETIAAENRAFIVEWIMRAINLGWLEEKTPNTEASSTPMRSSSSLVDPPPLSINVPNPSLQHLSPQPLWRPRVPAHDLLSSKDLRVDDYLVDDGPPSPIEPEEPDTNIVWTAQRIVQHWNQKDWSTARQFLEEQVRAVERGQTIMMHGRNVAPDVRILKHLIGISYSYQGDFDKAKDCFESVMRGIYLSGMPLDDGDIAAARWLGETCIHLIQPVNASLALAIALCGLMNKFGPRDFPPQALEDLQLLDQLTGGLKSLRNSFIQGNRDSSTIFARMASTDKYQVILSAIQHISSKAYAYDQSGNYYSHAPVNNITIAEGFLIQPLVSQASWPIPQDPFFRAQNAITLLRKLCKPKSPFSYNQVPTIGGLGQSKSLIFTTKLSLEWLVDTVRLALVTYAFEWKTNGPGFLCRLSHTHKQVAYYECYEIEFHKLPFRSIYGIKISERLYSTRGFIAPPRPVNGEEKEQFISFEEETKRKLIIRQELGDRLKCFLMEAEKEKLAGRKFPLDTPLPPRAPYELGGQSKPTGSELQADPVVELPAVQSKPACAELQAYPVTELPTIQRKPVGAGWQANPVVELPTSQLDPRELAVSEIVELPAEPYR